ncbi:hypothetical protein FRC12_010971 [Ceratobasidium sp. 428]|nr:hypothetical protein FRC12_010971 [Ceratobasidium sp. 428]
MSQRRLPIGLLRGRSEHPEISLTYDLPTLLKSTQSGWISAFQSSATVGALFAGLEGQLLTFVKGIDDDIISHTSRGYQALLILTYITFFFSVSATVSALILTDGFAELSLRAAPIDKKEKLDLLEKCPTVDTIEEIFEQHGVKKSCRYVKIHWIIMHLIGYFSLVAQILLYISLTDTLAVRVTVYFFVSFSVLPVLGIMF